MNNSIDNWLLLELLISLRCYTPAGACQLKLLHYTDTLLELLVSSRCYLHWHVAELLSLIMQIDAVEGKRKRGIILRFIIVQVWLLAIVYSGLNVTEWRPNLNGFFPVWYNSFLQGAYITSTSCSLVPVVATIWMSMGINWTQLLIMGQGFPVPLSKTITETGCMHTRISLWPGVGVRKVGHENGEEFSGGSSSDSSQWQWQLSNTR